MAPPLDKPYRRREPLARAERPAIRGDAGLSRRRSRVSDGRGCQWPLRAGRSPLTRAGRSAVRLTQARDGRDAAMADQRANAILVVSVGTSSLRVVASDPAVLLRVDVTHVGEAGFRYAVDGRPVVGAPEPCDLAAAIKLVGDLVRSRGIAVDAV